MKINVEQDHINSGLRQSTEACAVALAIKDAMQTNLVICGATVAYINHEEFSIPEEATQFIRNFDAELAVEPFTFELAKT